MVKVLLNHYTPEWVYIPECPCNDAFFTRFKFDQMNMIVNITTLVIYNDYHGTMLELSELLSEVYNVPISVYSGAIETNQYRTAVRHEGVCNGNDTEDEICIV